MRSFLPWALLLIFARGALLLSFGDVFFFGEELEKATAGKAMLDGLELPHHQLAYHYYEGGGFVISHLKALAFMLFGETLFANKAVALASCMGVLAAGWWACGVAFGASSSRFFAALYVFAPATVQKLSLISLGIHHEACVFILLALGLSASLMERQSPRSAAALGLCLGFGVYFSWVVALAAAACSLSLVLRWQKRVQLKCLAAVFGGAFLGALPLLLMFSIVGTSVFDIHGTGLASASQASLSETLRSFFRSIYLDGALGGVAGAIAWPVAVIAAIILGLKRTDVPEAGWSRSFRLHLTFVVIFIAAYLSSAFVQGAVYHFFLMLRLVPLWAVGVALMAAVLGRGWDDGGRDSPVVLCGFGVVALGAFGLYGAAAEGRPGELKRNWAELQGERGYVYPSYFEKLIPHIDGGQTERLKVLLGFEEDRSAMLRESIASELFRRQGDSLEADYSACRALVESIEPGRFPEYQRGLGPLLFAWLGGDLRSGLQALQAAGADAEVLSEALGRTGHGVRSNRGDPSLEGALGLLIEELQFVEGSPGATAYSRGVGWRLHWILCRSVYKPWRAADVYDAAPEALRASTQAGFEAAREDGRFDDKP